MPKRRMTIVFDDEELYTALKIAAVRQRLAAKDIVAAAVREWLESREDAAVLPSIEAARAEWKEKGGRPWAEVERELDEGLSQKEAARS